tara:strand:+ start:45 stop:362 length:318 start_codon:yes stop_codon:yes gene_type:complete
MLAAWSRVMINNNSELDKLRIEAKNITLNVGDIIIDHMADIRGILLTRVHHIDMVEDDVYLWEVKRFNNKTNEPDSTIMEEEGLKFSIAIGTVEWHSVEQNETIL